MRVLAGGDYDPCSTRDRERVLAAARSTGAPERARWLRLDELVALARPPRRPTRPGR